MKDIMYQFNKGTQGQYEVNVFENGEEANINISLYNVPEVLQLKIAKLIATEYHETSIASCPVCFDKGKVAGYPFCPECGMDSTEVYHLEPTVENLIHFTVANMIHKRF